ncbi:MAG: hypothetical protein MHPSP_001446, partial [Paramarteilia canceri]
MVANKSVESSNEIISVIKKRVKFEECLFNGIPENFANLFGIFFIKKLEISNIPWINESYINHLSLNPFATFLRELKISKCPKFLSLNLK